MFRPRPQSDRLDQILERLGRLEKDVSSHHGDEHERTKLVRKDCAYCDGTGQRPGPLGMASPVPCNVCKSRGYNLVSEDWVECRECGGTGKVMHTVGIAFMEKKCRVCKGIGWVSDNH